MKSREYKVRLVDEFGEFVAISHHRECYRNGHKIVCVWEEPNWMETGGVYYYRDGKLAMHAISCHMLSFKELRDFDRTHFKLMECLGR